MDNSSRKSTGKSNNSQEKSRFTTDINKRYWEKRLDEINIYRDCDENDSRQFSEVLPRDLYEDVCTSLNLPHVSPTKEEVEEKKERPPRRILKHPLLSYKKVLTVDREMDSDTDVETSGSEEERTPNVHLDLMSKPEREQITWPSRYLQPEREDEKSLIKKSDDLTDKIAQDFCEYMKELGGSQQSQIFTPNAIKELFQIEFDTHVARSLQVVPKELPTIGEGVANAIGHREHSRHDALEREITKDIKAERRKDLTRAFNTSMPGKERFLAPRNDTAAQWCSAKQVPRDLVTLKTVWEGITNLRSVRDYCRWMIDHPEYRRAPYLSSLGMFDPAVLRARTSFEVKSVPSKDSVVPVSIDHLRRKLSQLAEN